MIQTLLEQKAVNIDFIKNRPAISCFSDRMSLEAILEKAYITPEFFLHKHNQSCSGIEQIYNDYKDKNVLFTGEAGSGKTSAFLRLFMGKGDNPVSTFDKQFFYCYVPDLDWNPKSGSKYYEYYKELKKILKTGRELNGILLLDGLEEAFWDNSNEASKLLERLGESQITFWVSCRTNYYKKLDDSINSYFSERIEVLPWEKEKYIDFISLCLKDNTNGDVIKARIDQISEPIKSLLERPLYATMILFVADSYDLEDVHNEYELIGLFLNKWLERENERKNNVSEIEFESIRDIALSTYQQKKKRPQYKKELRAFRDLLVLTGSKGGSVHGFYHREFLVYFIANAMLDAALNHPENIVLWFSQTFYDDITNMIKPVLAGLDMCKSQRIYNNLFDVYKRTYEEPDTIEKECNDLELLPLEDSFLKLRDEILYFVFRLPNIDYETFAKYAYRNSTDTMLFLGIAYGMAGINPSNPYTLEFAKRLTPNTPEDIRNRGWAMCFFGDVEENGYKYTDSEGKPWPKIRENRLNRLKNNEFKYVATRVLDIPLLYCFYFSRGFADCTSYKDYTIIRDTDISLTCFGEEQRAFMSEQKKKLGSKYLEQLLLREINTNNNLGDAFQKEGINMDSDSNKTTLVIDQQLLDRILKQIEYKEAVLENIKSFWNKNGLKIVDHYEPQLYKPSNNYIGEEKFNTKIKDCKILIISANSVEGAVISHLLMKSSDISELDAWPYEGYLFQFATVDEIPVLHVWPSDTSSFTQFGSFSAVDTALNKFMPKYVLSVGVAFGINPKEQSLGDVLVSKELVFYDNFNKVTDGKITLNAHETYRINRDLEAQLHILDFPSNPQIKDKYKWYYGPMLTGGTVLSDAEERNQLLEAASNIGCKIVGGEMEGSGIYYACERIKDRHIPFLVIKGICDWGAEKNGWMKVVNKPNYDSETIKNCVQAFACNNAFDTMRIILSQLNF